MDGTLEECLPIQGESFGKNIKRYILVIKSQLGLPLLYECDAYNDDLPYWVDMDGEGLLIIPYTLDVNDMKFSVPPGNFGV